MLGPQLSHWQAIRAAEAEAAIAELYTKPDQTNRATGRTYRKVLGAAQAGSNGKRVVFVVGSNDEFRHIRAVLDQVTLGYLKNVHHGRWSFASGGFVDLAYIHNRFEGKRYDLVVVDELHTATWRDIERFQENIKYATHGEKT